MKRDYFSSHSVLLKEKHALLRKKKVLVVGAGGLGCAALNYLARCGFAGIGIVDGDAVEESNLQRQILFTRDDIGKNKASVVARKFRKVMPYKFFVDEKNCSIIKEYDLVVDCTDNMRSKLVINDACMKYKKPFVFGSALGWSGFCTLVYGKPCLRCIFHAQTQSSCSDTGVLNSVVGFIGALQCTEAVKFFTNKKTLRGKLFVYDAEKNIIKNIKYKSKKNCICNGGKMQENEISADELRALLKDGKKPVIIDVRQPEEREEGSIAGSVSIPMSELPKGMKKLDKNDIIITHCEHGYRSYRAMLFLRENGFKNVRSLAGGYAAWVSRN